MSKMYSIEIYEGKKRWAAYQAITPFGAISKGDIIDPAAWTDGPSIQSETEFEVTDVVHLLWDISVIRHKIEIYVKEVKWTRPT
jgi:hypothetical protein